MSALGELHSLTTADGLTRVFDGNPTIRVFGGYGAPPTRFVTERLFEQAGVIERDVHLDTRVITLELLQGPPASRQTYWDTRAALHDLLRPNRGGPLTLTLRLPNGARRALLVRPAPGLQFPPTPGDNAWLVREAVDFLAHDPIWYDPTPATYSAAGGAADQLIFPTYFLPADSLIRFGNENISLSVEVLYTGTWRTYPTLRLTGPYGSATLHNVVTGATILLDKAISAGQQRVLDLTPGQLRVTDAAGVDRFGDVDPGSNFVDFAILPAPEAPGGHNVLQVTLVEGDVASAISLSFTTRYFGV